MNAPLTAAEFSRLHKAIQQRDRQLAQGLSTARADSNILSALRNLSLYLPSQTQLAAVVKDWETSDQAKRSQIVSWLQQNILNDRSSPAPSQPPRETPSRTNFVSPPPPPPLPRRASTLPVQSNQHVFSSGEQAPASLHSRTTSTTIPTSTRANSAPVPPRELYTQARFRPPTPPPKDNISVSRNPSILGRNPSTRTSQASYQTNPLFTNSPIGETFPNAPTSPIQTTFNPLVASQSGPASPSSYYGSVGYPQSQQPQAQTSQHTPSNHQASNPPAAPTHNSNQNPLPNRVGSTARFLSRIAEMALKHQQSQLVQPANVQGSGSATASQSQMYGQNNYNQQLMEALGKIQAQQAQQAQQTASLMQQLAQAQQPAASNASAQTLAAAQQAQTNQILSMMQQYQQNTPTVDPSLYLAQSQQQSQQMMDLLLQTQSNAAPAAGIDWASLASGSGMDLNSLVGTITGGDPTGLMEGIGSGLMEGVGSGLMEGAGSGLIGGVASLFE